MDSSYLSLQISSLSPSCNDYLDLLAAGGSVFVTVASERGPFLYYGLAALTRCRKGSKAWFIYCAQLHTYTPHHHYTTHMPSLHSINLLRLRPHGQGEGVHPNMLRTLL